MARSVTRAAALLLVTLGLSLAPHALAVPPRTPWHFILDHGINRPGWSRGWYDALCRGVPNDYCRYVTMGSPNGAAYWSCALAGHFWQYTPPNLFTEAATSADACSPAKPARMALSLITDKGVPYLPNGWYDCNKNGVINDYCRWVSNSSMSNSSIPFWSCALAGGTTSSQQYTAPGQYTPTQCSSRAMPSISQIKPRMDATAITNKGNLNMSSGWFDAQCQGVANDYCRYVGDQPDLWWSCALAGGTSAADQYSPPGRFVEGTTGLCA